MNSLTWPPRGNTVPKTTSPTVEGFILVVLRMCEITGATITSMSASLNPPLLALATAVRTEQTITISSGDFLNAAVIVIKILNSQFVYYKPAVGVASREADCGAAPM
jgi:hypothetical protein